MSKISVIINIVDYTPTNCYNKPMLQDTLKQIGFSEKETLVYLAILENGRLSFTDISKKTGLNRTTTYSVAQELITRGVLQEDFSTPVKALVTAPPEALAIMTTQEEEQLNKKKVLISKVIDNIRSMPAASGYVAPSITFIPQQRIAQHLRQRTAEWNAHAMANDSIWWGFQDVTFVDVHGDWIKWYWESSPKNLVLKLFSNDKAIEKQMQSQTPTRREIRFWKGEQDFTGTLWISGDFVIMINTREKPYSLIEMRDKLLAQNLRTVFTEMWKLTDKK